MVMSIFNGTILHDQFGCCFFSYTGYSRNIICRISHKCFQINNLRRCNLVFFQHLFPMKIFDGCLTFGCFGKPDHDFFCCQLQKVSVSGKNGHIHSLLFAFFGKGSKKVICLIATFGYNFDSHGSKHFLDQRYLFSQFRWHRLSGSFVLTVDFVSESGLMNIKSHCKIIWFFFIQYTEKNVQKTINRASMSSL